ncbi:MAG: hydantoinase B/oxoprolinase family protein, partial [Pseudomonadota bacterium]
STTIAACYVALKHVFGEVPANAGVLEPIDFTIPEGSLLAATAPRPVGGYTETILRLIDLVFQAMAQIAPERSNGCAYGTINALSLSGHRTGKDGSTGARWVMFSFFGGGHGGHPSGDGLNHGNAPISTATIPPLEILEAAYPIKFTQWALRPDSGGAGQHRGGLGAIYEIELLEQEATGFLFGDRGKHPPRGVAGGGDAAMTRFSYPGPVRPVHPPMASKVTNVKLTRGQRVRLETPGGGGYGPAEARDEAMRQRDRDLGYVEGDQ